MNDKEQGVFAQASAQMHKAFPPSVQTISQAKAELERLYPKGGQGKSSNVEPMMGTPAADLHSDQLRSAPPLASVAMTPGLYAIRYINNWDGEGDICTVLARLDAKGKWTHDENGGPVLQYQGDQVLSAWPLTEAAAQVPYESLATAERIGVLEQEQQAIPLKAWRVRHADVVVARSARQAVEVLIAHMGEWLRETYHYTATDAVELADFELDRKPNVELGLTFQCLLDKAETPEYLGTLE